MLYDLDCACTGDIVRQIMRIYTRRTDRIGINLLILIGMFDSLQPMSCLKLHSLDFKWFKMVLRAVYSILLLQEILRFQLITKKQHLQLLKMAIELFTFETRRAIANEMRIINQSNFFFLGRDLIIDFFGNLAFKTEIEKLSRQNTF